MDKISMETRRESHEKTNSLKRQGQILDALGREKLTAREIAHRLGFTDLNAVKPRLTELKQAGVITTIGKKLDIQSNRMVAVFKKL